MERVISFNEDGSVEFTRTPELLALFEGQRMRVERMTDILFDDANQKFYIKFLKGPFKERDLKWDTVGLTQVSTDLHRRWHDFIEENSPGLRTICLDTDVENYEYTRVLFNTYEDAVKVEIAFVDYLREQGYSMK